MKYLKISLLLSTFIFIIILMYKSLAFTVFIYSPNSNINKDVTISITAGSSFKTIAYKLKRAKLIKDLDKFILLSKIKNIQNRVRAGEFVLNQRLTPMRLIEQLLHAHEKLYKFTIPEGYNMYQIANLLSNKGFVNKKKFLSLLKDKDFLKSIDFPYENLEGYLFPSTYKISKHTDEKAIIKMLFKKFNKVFNALKEKYGADKPLDDRSLVILASVIEKETSKVLEMPIIASVFYNRLNRGMKLQSDPTVIYGMWATYNGNIRRKDLRTYSPYNTYVVNGLPIGPIANPGQNSLKSTFKPAYTDYIFFVANHNREHVFTKTYAEHKKAVYKYQLRHHQKSH